MGLGHFGSTTGTIWRVWQQKATVFGLSLWWGLGAPRNLTSHIQNSLGQNLCGTSLWRLSRSLLYWLEIQLEVKWLLFFTFFPFHHEISATYLTFLNFSVLVYQTSSKVNTPFWCRLHNHRSGWLVAIVSNIISIAQHCWESGPWLQGSHISKGTFVLH